jgi:hypothetical protein
MQLFHGLEAGQACRKEGDAMKAERLAFLVVLGVLVTVLGAVILAVNTVARLLQ